MDASINPVFALTLYKPISRKTPTTGRMARMKSITMGRPGSRLCLLIFVKNQGTLDANPSVTTVVFSNKGAEVLQTPLITAGDSVALSCQIPQSPTNCFAPDCQFRITVDALLEVDESKENNNVVEGECKG